MDLVLAVVVSLVSVCPEMVFFADNCVAAFFESAHIHKYAALFKILAPCSLQKIFISGQTLVSAFSGQTLVTSRWHRQRCSAPKKLLWALCLSLPAVLETKALPRWSGRFLQRAMMFGMLLLSGPFVFGANAQEVAITNIVVTNSSSDLLLYLKAENTFTPEIIEGVQNGLPAVFSFEVKLTMIRSGWPDKEVYSGKIDHRLVYDNLKKDYTVTLAERNKEVVTDSLEKAKFLMEELNGSKVIALSALVPDSEYLLETRAVLAKKTLPFYMHYLIPFGDFWDFSTDWYEVRFKY